jgi:chemotaxis response regulator CheB
VILTGKGRDGARGIRALRQAGGTTIAQSPKSCAAPDMPAAAIETGCVDMVLPLARIAPLLQVLFSGDLELTG